MAGYEHTVIVGNVGRDPEMRYLQSGAAVCSFSVAVSSGWTDKNTNERREKTNWYRVTCWQKLAEIANQYVSKGKQVLVEGECTASAYIGQDGEARASLEIRARNFQLLGRRGDEQGQGAPDGNYDDQYAGGAPPPSNVDDIPF